MSQRVEKINAIARAADDDARHDAGDHQIWYQNALLNHCHGFGHDDFHSRCMFSCVLEYGLEIFRLRRLCHIWSADISRNWRGIRLHIIWMVARHVYCNVNYQLIRFACCLACYPLLCRRVYEKNLI